MKDSEFSELELKATIVPQQTRWPSNVLHWQKLHEVVDEARYRVATAWEAMEEIEKNPDLSPEGKQRQRAKVGAQAIDELEESKALAVAKEACGRQLTKWAEKSGLTIKPAANVQEAAVYSKIWDRIYELKGASRMAWLDKHGADPIVASALLTAPTCVSGISDSEILFLRKKVEQHVGPEIADARDTTLKAVKEAEQGWQKAIDKIGERAGLTKSPDGTWRHP